MSPYAATLDHPTVLEPCGYLANIDHPQHKAPFLMLNGAPPWQWSFSVVLRRVAFPLFAYPFMKIAGFDAGGFVASMVLNLAAFVWFTRFVRRLYGDNAAILTHWVLATYPGIPYWAGLPYSYAAIVPSCLIGSILLMGLEQAAGSKQILALSLGLAVVFLTYDLLPYFGGAASLILILRSDLGGRRTKALLAFGCGAILPVVAVNLLLVRILGLPLTNSNTEVYNQVVRAYLHLPDLRPEAAIAWIPNPHAGLSWLELLAQLPKVLAESYLFSNFLFLPLFMLGVWGLLAWCSKLQFSLVERCLLITISAGFLFNNLAPPYRGWQLRGMWIPRLYQPLVAVFLLFLARNATTLTAGLGERLGRGFVIAAAFLCVANASIAFGPILNNPLASEIDYRFYKHAAGPTLLIENLRRYGRRPLGFCAPPGERR